jgi:activator of 2-hydroxyglutaryl-CoA dehydratase
METNKENTTNDLLMLILNKLKHTEEQHNQIKEQLELQQKNYEEKQNELKEQLELQQTKHNQHILSLIQKDDSNTDTSYKSELGIDLGGELRSIKLLEDRKIKSVLKVFARVG